MSYRARINLDDPQLQTSLRNASKGSSAIPGASAEERGIFSSFGEREGRRLMEGQLEGQRMSNLQNVYNRSNKLSRKRLGLKSRALDLRERQNYFNTMSGIRDLSIEKDRLSDAKLGSTIGLGIGALSTGTTLYGARQDRLAREKQLQFTEALTKEWVKNNPTVALKYITQFPELGWDQYLPERMRSRYGDARR